MSDSRQPDLLTLPPGIEKLVNEMKEAKGGGLGSTAEKTGFGYGRRIIPMLASEFERQVGQAYLVYGKNFSARLVAKQYYEVSVVYPSGTDVASTRRPAVLFGCLDTDIRISSHPDGIEVSWFVVPRRADLMPADQ